MPPRKRRRTAWNALSATAGRAYAPNQTAVAFGPDGVLHFTLTDARTPDLSRNLFPVDAIDSPSPLKRKPALQSPVKPPHRHDDIAVLSFGSDASPSPQAPPDLLDETIDESPIPSQENKPLPASTPAVPVPLKPAATPPTAQVVRALLPAMDQELPQPAAPPLVQLPQPPSAVQTPRKSKSPAGDARPPATPTPTKCPLMVSRSAVRNAQKAMGFTPDSPGSQSAVLLVDSAAERELRAAQAAARSLGLSQDMSSLAPSSRHTTPLKSPLPNQASTSASKPPRLPQPPQQLRDSTTPSHVRRRLSGMSAVTPIPLHLESPPRAKENAATSPTPRAGCAAPLFTNGKGVPVPLPLQTKSHPQASLNGPLFTNGKGLPVHPREPGTAQMKKAHVASPITPVLEASAVPNPCPVPGPAKQVPRQSEATTPATRDPQPLFVTGKGVPVRVPNEGVSAANLSTAAFSTPRNSTVNGSSLFTTGSGKKVTIPPLPATPLPAQRGAGVASLFSTGKGKPVPVPQAQEKTPALISRRPLFQGEAVGSTVDPRESLLRDSSPAQERMEPRKLLHRVKNGSTPQARNGMISTPFRRPRRIQRSPAEKAATMAKQKKAVVPNIPVPRLLKNGRISCRTETHACPDKNVPLPVSRLEDMLLHVGSMSVCLSHKFSSNQMGQFGCLPLKVAEVFPCTLRQFGVEQCISWISSLFPGVSEKPASCVGSVAWTKLSYSLAVWKLGKLDLAKTGEVSDKRCAFLNATNVIREFLRRISCEWHGNRQPHLLRMLRRDSAPGSHAVLLVADIEESESGAVSCILTDGWYVARAILDETVERRVRRGRIRIGDKVHVVGASLQSRESGRGFFFGDGDELGTSVLRVCANNIRKERETCNERLGIQRQPMCSKSLRWIVDDGGQCPALQVLILRSYPIFFMESVQNSGRGDGEAPEYVFRREDAEYEARAKHEEETRQKYIALQEKKPRRYEDCEPWNVETRQVRCVKEILVCGLSDDPSEEQPRKSVRVYDPVEDMQSYLSLEGQSLLLTQVWPRRNSWTCKPQGVAPLRGKNVLDTQNLSSAFPRKICSIQDLQSNEVKCGEDFDGVFSVIHVSSANEKAEQRFVYLADNVGTEIRVLALEMSGFDAKCLPRAFRQGCQGRVRFPVVALQDIEFHAVSVQHELVHSRATLRSSFLPSKAVYRQRIGLGKLKFAVERVESQVRGKEAQLEVLREAVISFASGERPSIGAYFTSTQDM